MSDVYLIKKETLTAIADKIREKTRTEMDYEIPEAITPEEMPAYIEVNVADSNYDLGYADGQASSSEPSEVTDLTGTIWKLNSSIKSIDSAIYSINFISNGTNYNSISGSISGIPIQISIKYGITGGTATTVYSGKVGTAKWANYNYRIIEISGGTDATNAELITWL